MNVVALRELGHRQLAAKRLKAAFALKAGEGFRRGRFLVGMLLSFGHYRPSSGAAMSLISLFRFLGPAIERLTRVGNEIRYDMTIEDPEVFLEPWVMPTCVLTLAQGAAADRIRAERANCEVYEGDNNVTSQVRH